MTSVKICLPTSPFSTNCLGACVASVRCRPWPAASARFSAILGVRVRWNSSMMTWNGRWLSSLPLTSAAFQRSASIREIIAFLWLLSPQPPFAAQLTSTIHPSFVTTEHEAEKIVVFLKTHQTSDGWASLLPNILWTHPVNPFPMVYHTLWQSWKVREDTLPVSRVVARN